MIRSDTNIGLEFECHNKKLSGLAPIRLTRHLFLRYLLLYICFGLINTVGFSQQAFNAGVVNPTKSGVVKITRSWKLPPVLKNISAIDVVLTGKIACLQEEIGSIFVFSLETGEIENEIEFGPPGNYQGIALVGGDAYIACGDGRIIQVRGYLGSQPEVVEYGTHLTVTDEVNGLCYDRRHKRLLVTIGGSEQSNLQYKGIYAFGIDSKRMAVKPAIKIDLTNKVFKGLQPKNLQALLQPSDIDVHPINGLLYVIDGTRGQLLRMRMSESLKDLIELDKEDFIQPEGITFTPSGELFIASKGVRDEPGMLLQVTIN